MAELRIWGQLTPHGILSDSEYQYLKDLPHEIPSVQWIWTEMDRIWQLMNLNNRLKLDDQNISQYYSHPVWLLNGIFTSLDKESKKHRLAIAEYIKTKNPSNIADYAGGFAELALKIKEATPDATITIVEPYMSNYGKQRIQNIHQIKIADELSTDFYDVVIAQDVLEHVEDPIDLAFKIAKAVRKNGLVIFANCFYPVIQCHLPSTFHLRHTFKWVMKPLGIEFIGTVNNAPHALVFQRTEKELSIEKARYAESFSKLIGPVLNKIYPVLSWIYRKVKKP